MTHNKNEVFIKSRFDITSDIHFLDFQSWKKVFQVVSKVYIWSKNTICNLEFEFKIYFTPL